MRTKCPKCGLVNWSEATRCERCSTELGGQPDVGSERVAAVLSPTEKTKRGYTITEYFVLLWFFGVVLYGIFQALFSDDMGGDNLIVEMGVIVGVCVVITVALEIGRRMLASSKT